MPDSVDGPEVTGKVWGNVWGLIHFVWNRRYMHGARSTILNCAHLAIFMHCMLAFTTHELVSVLTYTGPSVLVRWAKRTSKVSNIGIIFLDQIT